MLASSIELVPANLFFTRIKQVVANDSQKRRFDVFWHAFGKIIYPRFDSGEYASPKRLAHAPSERSAVVPNRPDVIDGMPPGGFRFTEPRRSCGSASH